MPGKQVASDFWNRRITAKEAQKRARAIGGEALDQVNRFIVHAAAQTMLNSKERKRFFDEEWK